VFGRRFGNTSAELAAQYGPYEESTSFGAVLRADGMAVAAVRLVRPGRLRVKTLKDAAAPPWSVAPRLIDEAVGVGAKDTWDVASFGVDSAAVGADRRVVNVLLTVMFGAFRDNAVTSFVAMLDSVARRPLGGLGVQMLDLPGAKPAPYLGSASTVPVYRRVADLHSEHAEQFSQVHRQVFHGDGIDGVDVRLALPGSFTLVAA
jgi:lambda repressor-like predicted transcriptional regulator